MSNHDKANILIVDDLAEKLLVYRTILEELDENLVTVQSGTEALKQVLQQDFAVILLDVNMPDLDGFETAQYIRQRKRSSHTPIIFLTAFADEVRTAQGYATGGVDYIPTPVVPEILRAKVKVFIDLFRLRRQVARQAEEQARREAAEESARRFAFLADASRALASSLDVGATLQRISELSVPQLANIAYVCMVDESGAIAQSNVAPKPPDAGRFAGVSLLFEDPEFHSAVQSVVDSNTRLVLDQSNTARPNLRSAMWDVNVSSLTILPLMVRNRARGVLALAWADSASAVSANDLALAEELALRGGVALDNALLVSNIQENDRRKNEFLAILAHELRNPLAPIRNTLEILRLRSADQPDISWARDIIHRQLVQLVRMVDDLLDLSRITRGKITLRTEHVDLAEVLSAALETSRPVIEASRHRIDVEIPPAGKLWIKGDNVRLAQVFSNLLNNAAKYTPENGEIRLSAERQGDDLVIRVRDNGAGIPREMLSRVFEMFTQVEHSLDRSQGGLGIGLTLVRHLVQLHGGSVQAYSDGPGRGSEFLVRLPAQTPTGIKGRSDGKLLETRTPQPTRVLIVDDNVDGAQTLAMLVRACGYQVEVCHNGFAALETAPRFMPDVVLLDIGMPGMDGYEVARRLRTNFAAGSMLIVAISGYGQEQDLRRSREGGIDHHFVKPVEIEPLTKLLSSHAAQRSTQGSARFTVVG